MTNETPRIEIKNINSSILVRVVEKEEGIATQYCNIARIDYDDGYLTKQQAQEIAKKIVNTYKKEWIQ